MNEGQLFEELAIAVGLGLLVGLQRQRTSHIAGVRTFPLITLLGSLCAILARSHSGWILLAGLLGVVAAMVLGNMAEIQGGKAPEPGITTEVAMLVMYMVGALVVVGSSLLALVVGGTVAVLLQAKAPLHRLSDRLGEDDLTAIMRFVLVTFIILPVVPNRTYGPLDVVNPHVIWLMVVLIVGISLFGYIGYKLFGQNAGMLLGGILGGLISSTATTISYARRTREDPEQATLSAAVIVIASAVLWGRLVIVLLVAAPGYRAALAPLLIAGAISAVPAFFLWLQARREPHEIVAHGNPTELKTAMFYAGLFAVILLAVAAAREYLGARGVYLVAAVSGLTDVDAITLSMARLVHQNAIAPNTAWRVVVVAVLANLVFKGSIAVGLGHGRLLRPVALSFLVSFVVGGLLLWLW